MVKNKYFYATNNIYFNNMKKQEYSAVKPV